MLTNILSSTHMAVEADIVLETPNKRLLHVECTWMKEPSMADVIEVRDDLSELWTIESEYFMLALQTDLHLWRTDAPAGSQPLFTASPRQIWHYYLGERGDDLDFIRSEVMIILLGAWLNALAHNIMRLDPDSEADQLLIKSGLYDRMKRGVVTRHAPA